MRPGDADEAYSLILSCLDEYYRPEIPMFFLGQWPRGSLVARDLSGEIAGYLAGALLPGQRASISLFCVHPAYRGRGVGGNLLKHFMTCAMAEGIRTVQLEVREDNGIAMRFYSRRGFSITEKLPGFYSDGGNAVRMCAPISMMSRVFMSFLYASGMYRLWKTVLPNLSETVVKFSKKRNPSCRKHFRCS